MKFKIGDKVQIRRNRKRFGIVVAGNAQEWIQQGIFRIPVHFYHEDWVSYIGKNDLEFYTEPNDLFKEIL